MLLDQWAHPTKFDIPLSESISASNLRIKFGESFAESKTNSEFDSDSYYDSSKKSWKTGQKVIEKAKKDDFPADSCSDSYSYSHSPIKTPVIRIRIHIRISHKTNARRWSISKSCGTPEPLELFVEHAYTILDCAEPDWARQGGVAIVCLLRSKGLLLGPHQER